MTTPGSPTALEYDALHDSLVHAGVVLALPEVHGGICGALCAGGPDAALRWLEQALVDDPHVDDSLVDAPLGDDQGADAAAATLATLRDALRELVDASFRMLDGESLAFEPLLPNDDALLEEQVQALAAWCQGFLAALGEHAPEIAHGDGRGKRQRATERTSEGESAAEHDSQGAPTDIAEILEDFAEISRAGLSEDEVADRDQADFALAELKEYARVSAQIVFEELRPRRAALSRDVH